MTSDVVSTTPVPNVIMSRSRVRAAHLAERILPNLFSISLSLESNFFGDSVVSIIVTAFRYSGSLGSTPCSVSAWERYFFEFAISSTPRSFPISF